MKAMKLRERNVMYLDWNHTYFLKPVFARRFIKNGWTHVIFNGVTIKARKHIYAVVFNDPLYSEKGEYNG
jgi:hypothetical protein